MCRTPAAVSELPGDTVRRSIMIVLCMTTLMYNKRFAQIMTR